MIDIIQNPDAIATLKHGDVVAAGQHQYRLHNIDVGAGDYNLYFTRCDAEWEQERIPPAEYEESVRRAVAECDTDDLEIADSVTVYDYADCFRHIRFVGRAVTSVEEATEAIKNGTAKFNC